MKKLLILALASAMMLSAGCDKKETKGESVYSEASINAVMDYLKDVQTGVDEDTMKEQVVQLANYVKAADTLEIDTAEAMKEAIESVGGEKALESAKKNGTPQAYIDLLLGSQACQQAITEYMEENNLFGDVNADEYFKNNYWRAKHVLISTEDKSDEEKEQAKQKAEDILKRAENGEDFDALVSEFSEDPGSKSNPDGYVFTANQMVKEFEDGTKNTEPGKFTLVQTNYGWHVIQRLALDETPELYAQFFEQANVEPQVKNEAVTKFVEETLNK